jgi:hypothetical protein
VLKDRKIRNPDVPHLAGFLQFPERIGGFFQIGDRIEMVEQENVDVICVQFTK